MVTYSSSLAAFGTCIQPSRCGDAVAPYLRRIVDPKELFAMALATVRQRMIEEPKQRLEMVSAVVTVIGVFLIEAGKMIIAQ